ncbi:MAG: hypothetical protein HYR73_06385, partial [Candidatus Eisenbacteria bacterium]|nr:hypothetical protein [Candidatus Eisenbacteria bacterium]
MTCAEFDRWLNEGCPGAGHAPALAHARECARCAGAWAGALEIDRRLTSFTPATPAGFAARVMTRVGAAPRRAAPWSPPDPMDWWVRAAADPATVLALALAAV